MPLAQARIAAAQLVPPVVLVTADDVEPRQAGPRPVPERGPSGWGSTRSAAWWSRTPGRAGGGAAAGCFTLAVLHHDAGRETRRRRDRRPICPAVRFEAVDGGGIRVRLSLSEPGGAQPVLRRKIRLVVDRAVGCGLVGPGSMWSSPLRPCLASSASRNLRLVSSSGVGLGAGLTACGSCSSFSPDGRERGRPAICSRPSTARRPGARRPLLVAGPLVSAGSSSRGRSVVRIDSLGSGSPARPPTSVDRGAVRGHLAQRLGDLAAVEAQAEDRVGPGRLGHLHQPGDRVLAGLGQHGDVAVDRVAAAQIGPQLAGRGPPRRPPRRRPRRSRGPGRRPWSPPGSERGDQRRLLGRRGLRRPLARLLRWPYGLAGRLLPVRLAAGGCPYGLRLAAAAPYGRLRLTVRRLRLAVRGGCCGWPSGSGCCRDSDRGRLLPVRLADRKAVRAAARSGSDSKILAGQAGSRSEPAADSAQLGHLHGDEHLRGRRRSRCRAAGPRRRSRGRGRPGRSRSVSRRRRVGS